LVRLLHDMISLQLAIYFSIVRLRAAWASFVKLSTSWSTITLKPFEFFISMLVVLAVSLMTF
jgi:hypothetical protein